MAPITVMTRGEAGALITVEQEEFEIPPAKPKAVVDPTGAGDAFRAGFVLGLKRHWPWPLVGRVAALTAVYAIEHRGPQSHSYTLEEFVGRYQENYGRGPRARRSPGRRVSLRSVQASIRRKTPGQGGCTNSTIG